MEDRQGVDHKDSGIVFALAMTVKAYTEPGDYILIRIRSIIHSEVIGLMTVKWPANIFLIRKEDGSYAIDFEDFERGSWKKCKIILILQPTTRSAGYGQGKKWSVGDIA